MGARDKVTASELAQLARSMTAGAGDLAASVAVIKRSLQLTEDAIGMSQLRDLLQQVHARAALKPPIRIGSQHGERMTDAEVDALFALFDLDTAADSITFNEAGAERRALLLPTVRSCRSRSRARVTCAGGRCRPPAPRMSSSSRRGVVTVFESS